MTYNWHEESRASFLSWLLPTAIADYPNKEKEDIERLSVATEKFTKIDLVLEISGVRISGEQLFTDMYNLMRREMEKEATRYVKEFSGMEKIEEAQDDVAAILRDAQRAIKRKFEDAGLEFPSEEW